jgi:hypothetical protein
VRLERVRAFISRIPSWQRQRSLQQTGDIVRWIDRSEDASRSAKELARVRCGIAICVVV